MPSSFCRRQLSTRCALTLTPCLRLALPSPPPPLQPPPPALVPLRAARCFPPPAQDEVKEFFGDPYSMQMYGIVFGYLSIARMTVSYQRYWEGVTHVKTMHAKWIESCSQVIASPRPSLGVLTLVPTHARVPHTTPDPDPVPDQVIGFD